jgi:hypothetical protein
VQSSPRQGHHKSGSTHEEDAYDTRFGFLDGRVTLIQMQAVQLG